MALNLNQLHPYQHEIVDYIVDTPRCGVFVPMGMGKTVSVLTAISTLKTLGELKGKVLIVAPLRVAQSTWPDEIQEWEHLRHLSVSVIVGKPEARRKALRAKVDIFTINYENLGWLEKELDGRWPFEMVVADESTKLKGFRTRQGAARPRVLAKVAHCKITRFVQLTGTPAPNGVKDLWACGWFIDRGQRLGNSYSAFTNRWFRRDYTGFNYEPMPHAQKEIEGALSDVCFSLDAKKHLNVKDPIKIKRTVKLPVDALKQYKRMEREMFAEVSDILTGAKSPIAAVNAAAKTMKCLQLTNGAAYVGEDNSSWTEVHDEKLNELESIVEEASGMPVLVAYHFKSDLARLKKKFPQGKALDKNPQTMQDWNKGRIPVMFAHPASAGHGLSLQHGGNIIAFFSLNWNLEEHQQIIERIGPTRQMQSGYDRPTFVYYILAEDTIDTIVLDRLEGKGEVQDLLMRALQKKE